MRKPETDRIFARTITPRPKTNPDPIMPDYDFARRLFYTTRMEHELTQQAMADLLGMTRVHVNRIENGHAPLTNHAARSFMRVFRMTDTELYQEDCE